jgi:hypothetical protein
VGCRVDVMEFVDSEHMPRTLLRGSATGADASAEMVSDHRRLGSAWEVTPALARFLEPDPAEVLRS